MPKRSEIECPSLVSVRRNADDDCVPVVSNDVISRRLWSVYS